MGCCSVYLPITYKNYPPPLPVKNIILLIGDGMGFEHIRATGMYLNGAAGTLVFESFPYFAQVTTFAAGNVVTDSAAASTAMATGHKVNEGVISVALPGDSHELYTILEYVRDHGLSTGLVTTTNITSATPAGFGAHTTTREDTSGIAYDYLNQTRPNVLFGGGGYGLSKSTAQAAGYTVVTDQDTLLALNTEQYSRVSGQFGTGSLHYEYEGMSSQPHLSQMAAAAFNILDNDPDGFFVMVEGGLIDHAASANDIKLMIGEVVEFNNTVQAAINYANTHPGTLIVVTADHETGGLTVVKNNGAGRYPTVTWSSIDHTGVNVGLWILGLAASSPSTPVDNTQIPALITNGSFP